MAEPHTHTHRSILSTTLAAKSKRDSIGARLGMKLVRADFQWAYVQHTQIHQVVHAHQFDSGRGTLPRVLHTLHGRPNKMVNVRG